MALKLWLPLIGNLDNKGAGNITVTNNGATVDNNGKVGKCYSFNGNNYYISLVGQQLFDCFKGGAQQFSIAMWVYHGDSRRAILFGDYNTSGCINVNVELSTAHVVRFYWNASPDVTPSTMNIGASTWHHVGITYDGSTVRFYLDGTLKATQTSTLAAKDKTSGEFRLGRDSRTTDTALNGKLNDFRIYDHCLSSTEIREIAQGLILHYKLDGFIGGRGNSNLVTSFDTSFSSYNDGAVTLFVNQMNGGAQEIVSNIPGTRKCLHLHSSGSSNRQYSTLSVVSGKNYTFSLDYYSTSNQASTIRSELNGGNYSWSATDGPAYTTPGKWVRISLTTTNLTSNSTLYYFIYCANGTDCYIKNLKIEEGTSATDWVLGNTTSDMIADSSGYGHHGTINDAALKVVKNSACHSFAIQNSQANNSATFPFKGQVDMAPSSSLTFAWWMNPTTWGIQTSGIFSTSGEDVPTDYNSTTANMRDSCFDCCNTSGTCVRIGVSDYLTLNEWHHYALVYNGSLLIFYKDGVQKATASQTGNLKGFKNIFPFFSKAGGVNRCTSGALSDFRIYATSLPAEDIRRLCTVKAKNDNRNTVHSYEFNELTNAKSITSNGSIKFSRICESYKHKTNFYKCTNPNLLSGNVNIITTKSGTVSSNVTIGSVAASVIQSLAGQKLTMSYEVCTSGGRYSTEQGQTAWSQTRYGIHGACSIGGSTNYPFADNLNYSGNSTRVSMTWTIPSGASSYGALTFAVQNYDKPSSTNNATWFIRNIKIEVGASATPYVDSTWMSSSENGGLLADNLIEI